MVELLATEYPDVDFIIPHLGSFMDDWRAQVALIDPLERHPNIHTDSSGVRRFDLLLDAVGRAGPEKVLFGSTGRGCIPASSCTRSGCSGSRRRARGSCSARTSCG